MRWIVRIERHELGPRIFVLGRRVHEYQVGFPLLAVSSATSLVGPAHVALPTALVALWLVVKDWPDLFPATRDKASWSLGLHRLPRDEAERDARPAPHGRIVSGTASPESAA